MEAVSLEPMAEDYEIVVAYIERAWAAQPLARWVKLVMRFWELDFMRTRARVFQPLMNEVGRIGHIR